MNVDSMLNLLALRLQDPKNSVFPQPFKLRALNNAQVTLAQLLHNSYLTELQYIDEDKTATSGELALSELTHDVLRGAEGILKLKIKDGLYCIEQSVEELKATENTFLVGSDGNPLYYLFQNKIYMLTTIAAPHIDVFYLKMPTQLISKYTITEIAIPTATEFIVDADQGLDETTNDIYKGAVVYSVDQQSYHVVTAYTAATRTFTVSPAADTNFETAQEVQFLTHSLDTLHLTGIECDLNESLHELIVSFAEAECWAKSGELDRRTSALNSAFAEVKVLNERYTAPENIG